LKRAAVFDIGSVSVKMLVAEADGKGGFRPLLERARVTRLGEGLADRADFLPVASERTLKAAEEFAAEAMGLGVERMEALGTEALRRVTDAGPFAAELARLTGVALEILDPASEARLAYRSGRALVEDGDTSLCTLDVGGGSTEVLSGQGALPLGRALLPVGALRLKEACVRCEPPGEAEVACMVRTVGEASSGRFGELACSRLVGMGGTIMVLSSILRGEPSFEPPLLHGRRLSLEGVRSVIRTLVGLTPEERAQVNGLPADRADLALPGAVIVAEVMTGLGVPDLVASAWGIRHGRAAEIFETG